VGDKLNGIRAQVLVQAFPCQLRDRSETQNQYRDFHPLAGENCFQKGAFSWVVLAILYPFIATPNVKPAISSQSMSS